jgi:Na+/H+-dicarboxylate symporter
MIISPLVFSTLVVGIAAMGDITTVGRIGARRVVHLRRLCRATLGLVMVGMFEPGKAMHLPIPAANARESRRRACRSKGSSRMRFR